MFSKKKFILGIFCISIFLKNDACFSAVFNVTTNADSGAGSFRQAITDLNSTGGASNTIDFTAPSLNISLSSSLPSIQKPVSITGNNSAIQGASTGGLVFNAQATDAIQVSGLSITGTRTGGTGGSYTIASPTYGGGGGGAALGGGICVIQGSITLDTMSLTGCSAQGGDGGDGTGGSGGVFNGGGGGGIAEEGPGNGDGVDGGDGYDGALKNSGQFSTSSGFAGSGWGGGSAGSGSTGAAGGIGGGGAGAGASEDGPGYSGGGSLFGGGAGGGSPGPGTAGGVAGFGGGNGSPGTTAVGITPPSSAGGGGGGAGFGGGIFINQGSSLTLIDPVFSGNSVKGGTGGGSAFGSESLMGAGGSFAGADVFMMPGAVLTFDLSSPLTISSDASSGYAIASDPSGSGGGIIKTGSATLTFIGPNTYVGSTTFTQGILSVAADNSLGSSTTTLILNGGTLQSTATFTSNRAATLSSSGTIDVTSGNTLTMSGVFSGSGSLTKQNTGTLILTGANTYTGGTTVSAGILQGNTIGFQGNITNNASVIFDQTGSGTYAGAMSGSGTLTKQNTGTLILTGANTYTGGTTVSAGILQGSTTSLQGAITNNASVVFDQTTTGTYAGAMSGSGTLTKQNTGTLILTGANTYTGGTTVSAGILQGSTTSLQGAITNNASVVFDQTSTGTYVGVISGSGTLTKQNTGTVVLTGTNTYSGGTILTGGILSVGADNNLGAVSGGLSFSGGTLQSTATFTSNRAATLSSSGTIDVTSGNTLTMSGVFSGSGSLTKANSGTLILTGANTYTGGTTVSAGILQGNTTGLQGNITNNASVIFDQTGSGTYAGAMSGSGTLTKQNTGTLILTGANTYTGGTIISAGTLRGSTTSLQGAITNNASVVFDQTSTGTYVGVISGSGTLTKQNTGTVVLTGTNTYSGGTILTGGILSVGADNNLGAASGGLTFSGGTLQSTATFTSNRAATLSSSGTIDVTSGNTLTMSGVFSGSGSLTKANSGTFILTGTNTYSGGTILTGGILSVGADNNLGAVSGGLTFSGGTLQSTATFTSNRAATLSSSDTIDVTSGNTLTMSGVFSGSGSLTKANSGTLILTGANTYTGGTTVSAGILQGNTTSLQGNITNNASVIFDQTGSGIYAGAMSGSGTLTKQNTGTLILTGANTYTGGTTISAGTLQGNTTSLQGNITDNAILVFDQTTTGTYNGILSGSGTLTKQGSGTLTFSNNSAIFAGTTLINAGTFLINGQLGGICTVSSGGTLGGNGTIGSVINSGIVSPGTSIGTLTINGNYTQDPTGTLLIEITPDGATDLLQVTGTATLDGTLEISPEPGVYTQGITYTILTASTRTGQFSNTFSDMPFDYTVLYRPNQVLLFTGAPSIILRFPRSMLCGNARTITDYLFCPSFDFSNTDLITIVKTLIKASFHISLEEYQLALTKLTPSQLGSLPLTELENNYALANTFFVAGIGQRSHCYVDTEQPTSIWINPLGFVYSQDDQHNAGSCPFQKAFGFTTHTYGVAGGVDHLFDDNWSIGAGIGYSHTKLNWKQNAGKAQANTVYLGPYLKYDSEYFYFDFLLLGAGNFYDLERKIAFPGFERKAHSDPISWNLSEILLAGARLELFHINNFFLQPEILLDQLNSFQQSFKENGAHSINLAVKSQYSSFFRSLINAKLIKEWYTSDICFIPSVNVGWLRTIPLTGGHYTAKFKTGTFCQSDFSVSSFHKAINQLLIGAQLLISQGSFEFSAGYEGKFGEGSTVNEWNAAMRWRF